MIAVVVSVLVALALIIGVIGCCCCKCCCKCCKWNKSQNGDPEIQPKNDPVQQQNNRSVDMNQIEF